MSVFGYFWVFLGIFGYFWVFLGVIGYFWVFCQLFIGQSLLVQNVTFFGTDVMWYEVLSYAVVELCVT